MEIDQMMIRGSLLGVLCLTGVACQQEAVPTKVGRSSSLTATKKHEGRALAQRVSKAKHGARQAQLVTAPSAPVAITTPTRCDTTTGVGPVDRTGCEEITVAARVIERVEDLDPFVADEIADADFGGWGASLLARSSTPLTVGDDVYVQKKFGPYTPCSTVTPPAPCGSDLWDEQTWGVVAYRWVGSQLVKQWERTTTWHPVGGNGLSQEWEPLFQPVIVGDFIYLPEGNGRVSKISRATGQQLALIGSPLDGGAGDEDTYVSSALSADRNGNVFYTVMALTPNAAPTAEPRNSWLVKATPADAMASATIASITAPNPPCVFSFSRAGVALPWPPAPGAVGPVEACGSMRPSVNVAPVPSADGSRVYVLVRTRRASDNVWLDAVEPGSLTRIWSVSLRDKLLDDCGVLTAATALPGETTSRLCRVGSDLGVDRETGLAPAGKSLDLSTSTPVELPDGGIAIGTYTRYDNEKGHLYVLNADGSFRWAFNFGWVQTPGIIKRPGSPKYDLVQASSHYNTGPFFTQALGDDGRTAWQTANTSTESCTRDGDLVTCVPAEPADPIPQNQLDCFSRPGGVTDCKKVEGGGIFEFVARTPLVTGKGDVWTTASDGHTYRMSGTDGRVLDKVFVDTAVPSNDAPLSADRKGRIYVVQFGNLAVLGAR
jgi:outer membrane protein assembly factor BamB